MYIVLINNIYLTSFDTIEEAEEGEVAIILNTEWESNKGSLYIETISL